MIHQMDKIKKTNGIKCWAKIRRKLGFSYVVGAAQNGTAIGKWFFLKVNTYAMTCKILLLGYTRSECICP